MKVSLLFTISYEKIIFSTKFILFSNTLFTGQEENLTKVRGMGPPSTVAARHEFFKQQRKEIILNGRPPNCVGPPIFLYHEVFSKFSSDFNNENLDLSNGLCAWTSELIETMANEHINEDSRKNAFINHITEFIGKLLEVRIEDGSSNDGMLLIETACGENGLRIIHEIKNEIGEGGSDPTIQATLSYSKYWAQEQVYFLYITIFIMYFHFINYYLINYS